MPINANLPSNAGTSARERYAQRLAHIAAVRKRLAERNAWFVIARTILFFVAAILIASGFMGAEPRGVLMTVGWTAAGLFLVVVTLHEHLRLNEVTAQRQAQLYERLLARLDRRWSDMPTLGSASAERSSLADDLDLFGEASLWQLLALPSTSLGRKTLCEWLLAVPSWTVLHERQAAVQELRDAAAEREAILECIASISVGAEDAVRLSEWAAGPRWLPTHRLAHGLSFAGPLLVLCGVIALVIAGLSQEPQAVAMWIAAGLLGAGFAINLLLTLGWGSWLHDIFIRVTGPNRDAQQLSSVFEQIGDLPGESALIADIRQRASRGERSAVAGFRQLLWRVRLANLQRDPLFYIVYLMLQLAIAWDFRVMESLERWQQKFSDASHQWFEALGECEALIAGATLADEYRQWCFAEPCSDAGTIFSVTALGHPLLPDAQRVTNDLTLSRAQPLLLVTGSNMAGKSTLLRALGLNQILARCGAPVCAREYRTPLFELATSIRVRDSLKEGVSFFMAELKRLKEVVDIAERASGSRSGDGTAASAPVMFLLDEILQGTNSRERQIAVMKVVERLLQCGAVGAISTHDLELADQSEVQRISQIVHFREYFERSEGAERMRFDYQMRSGPTPTTNALKLLSMVGLDTSA
ncbi:MAG: MutS-related protein [Aureliella sp.]